MNIFFGLETNNLNINIKIPNFKNDLFIDNKVQLLKAKIKNEKKWLISKPNIKLKNNFYFIENKNLSDEEIYFLALKNEFDCNPNIEIESDIINDYSEYTNTKPAYRCSLNVENNLGGFSSYQSEYPYQMTKRTGSVVSPIINLLDKKSEKNLIFFRNIYYLPVNIKFNAFLVDYFSKEVIEKKIFTTNKTNIFDIKKEYIRDGVFLFVDGYLGIPIYFMEKENHISFEHTHPLTEYILDKNRYKIINKFKDEFKNIVEKN